MAQTPAWGNPKENETTNQGPSIGDAEEQETVYDTEVRGYYGDTGNSIVVPTNGTATFKEVADELAKMAQNPLKGNDLTYIPVGDLHYDTLVITQGDAATVLIIDDGGMDVVTCSSYINADKTPPLPDDVVDDYFRDIIAEKVGFDPALRTVIMIKGFEVSQDELKVSIRDSIIAGIIATNRAESEAAGTLKRLDASVLKDSMVTPRAITRPTIEVDGYTMFNDWSMVVQYNAGHGHKVELNQRRGSGQNTAKIEGTLDYVMTPWDYGTGSREVEYALAPVIEITSMKGVNDAEELMLALAVASVMGDRWHIAARDTVGNLNLIAAVGKKPAAKDISKLSADDKIAAMNAIVPADPQYALNIKKLSAATAVMEILAQAANGSKDHEDRLLEACDSITNDRFSKRYYTANSPVMFVSGLEYSERPRVNNGDIKEDVAVVNEEAERLYISAQYCEDDVMYDIAEAQVLLGRDDEIVGKSSYVNINPDFMSVLIQSVKEAGFDPICPVAPTVTNNYSGRRHRDARGVGVRFGREDHNSRRGGRRGRGRRTR